MKNIKISLLTMAVIGTTVPAAGLYASEAPPSKVDSKETFNPPLTVAVSAVADTLRPARVAELYAQEIMDDTDSQEENDREDENSPLVIDPQLQTAFKDYLEKKALLKRQKQSPSDSEADTTSDSNSDGDLPDKLAISSNEASEASEADDKSEAISDDGDLPDTLALSIHEASEEAGDTQEFTPADAIVPAKVVMNTDASIEPIDRSLIPALLIRDAAEAKDTPEVVSDEVVLPDNHVVSKVEASEADNKSESANDDRDLPEKLAISTPEASEADNKSEATSDDADLLDKLAISSNEVSEVNDKSESASDDKDLPDALAISSNEEADDKQEPHTPVEITLPANAVMSSESTIEPIDRSLIPGLVITDAHEEDLISEPLPHSAMEAVETIESSQDNESRNAIIASATNASPSLPDMAKANEPKDVVAEPVAPIASNSPVIKDDNQNTEQKNANAEPIAPIASELAVIEDNNQNSEPIAISNGTPGRSPLERPITSLLEPDRAHGFTRNDNMEPISSVVEPVPVQVPPIVEDTTQSNNNVPSVSSNNSSVPVVTPDQASSVTVSVVSVQGKPVLDAAKLGLARKYAVGIMGVIHRSRFNEQDYKEIERVLKFANQLPGVHEEVLSTQDENGNTLLHRAVINGDIRLINLLLERARSSDEIYRVVAIMNNKNKSVAQVADDVAQANGTDAAAMALATQLSRQF